MGRIQTRTTKMAAAKESGRRPRSKMATTKTEILSSRRTRTRLSNFPRGILPNSNPKRQRTKEQVKQVKKQKSRSRSVVRGPKTAEPKTKTVVRGSNGPEPGSVGLSQTTTTTSVITVISTNTTSGSVSTSQQQVSISMFQREENIEVAVKDNPEQTTSSGCTDRRLATKNGDQSQSEQKRRQVVQHLKHVADIIEYVATGRSVVQQNQQNPKEKSKTLCLRSRTVPTESSGRSRTKNLNKTRNNKSGTVSSSFRFKRKRVASLNASAKVHCLLENELVRAQTGTGSSENGSSTDSSSGSESESEPLEPKKKRRPAEPKKKESSPKTENRKRVVRKRRAQQTTKKQKRKKRSSMEVVALDSLDVVVPKRVASLNASAILAVTSQWDKPQRQRPRPEDAGDTSRDEDYSPTPQYRTKSKRTTKAASPLPSSSSSSSSSRSQSRSQTPEPRPEPKSVRVASFKSDFRCAVESQKRSYLVSATHSYQVSSSSSSSSSSRSGTQNAQGDERGDCSAARRQEASDSGRATEKQQQLSPEIQSTTVGSYSPLGALYNMKPPINQQQQQLRTEVATGLAHKEEKAWPAPDKTRPLDERSPAHQPSTNHGGSLLSSSMKLHSGSPSPLTVPERSGTPCRVSTVAAGPSDLSQQTGSSFPSFPVYRTGPPQTSLLLDRPSLEPFLTCYPPSAFATDPYAYHRSFPFLNPAGYVPIPLPEGYAGYPGPPPVPPTLPPIPPPQPMGSGSPQDLHSLYSLHRIPFATSCYPRYLPGLPYPTDFRAAASSLPAAVTSMHGERNLLPALAGLEAAKPEASQLLLTTAQPYCAAATASGSERSRAMAFGHSSGSCTCLGHHASVPCPKNAQAGLLTGEAKRSGPTMTTTTVAPHTSTPVSLGRPTSGSTTSPAVPCLPPELPCSSVTELVESLCTSEVRKRKPETTTHSSSKKKIKTENVEQEEEPQQTAVPEPVACRLRSRLSSVSSESTVLDNSVTSSCCFGKTKRKKTMQKEKKTKSKDPVNGSANIKSRVLEAIANKLAIKEKKKNRSNNNNNNDNKVEPSLKKPEAQKKKKTIISRKKSNKKDSVQKNSESSSLVLDETISKPRWSNGWTWEGKPYEGNVYLRNDEPPVMRKCYPAIRHEEGDFVQVRDCLLLKSGTKAKDLPFIAKVSALWENAEDGEMMISLLWYYRPEHTDHGRRSCDLEMEVFASRHQDVCSVACIEDVCYVLTFNEYCRYRKEVKMLEEGVISPALSSVPCDATPYPRRKQLPPPGLSPDRVFLCRKVYDFRQKRILKNPT